MVVVVVVVSRVSRDAIVDDNDDGDRSSKLNRTLTILIAVVDDAS